MAVQHNIGVISDTHIPHRMKEMPPIVFENLQGCELILHAGDLEDIHILDPLRQIAPVYAVRGNVHWQASMGTHDQDLPNDVLLPVGGHIVYMTHGHINFVRTMMDKVFHFTTRPTLTEVNYAIMNRIARMKPRDADIIIFGHTHKPFIEQFDGALYFNPGAVCRTKNNSVGRSMGRLVISELDGVKAELISIQI